MSNPRLAPVAATLTPPADTLAVTFSAPMARYVWLFAVNSWKPKSPVIEAKPPTEMLSPLASTSVSLAVKLRGTDVEPTVTVMFTAPAVSYRNWALPDVTLSVLAGKPSRVTVPVALRAKVVAWLLELNTARPRVPLVRSTPTLLEPVPTPSNASTPVAPSVISDEPSVAGT